MGYYSKYERWPRYVSVAERKEKAAKHIAKLEKKGTELNPVVIEGRTIAKTFWGKAWCDNLEAYSDFDSRLPRGRTYARNGSIIDLQLTKGQVKAQVMGSSLYKVTIDIKPIAQNKWKALVEACAGKIDSLIELLQGKFSKAVMEILTEKENGLFPKPQEITMKCSCPDYADMCKHIAAVLYGVGAKLDTHPEGLFDLRHVDHVDLLTKASQGSAFIQNQTGDNLLEDTELSSLFGIEMASENSKTIKQEDTPVKPIKKPVRSKSKAEAEKEKKTIGKSQPAPKISKKRAGVAS